MGSDLIAMPGGYPATEPPEEREPPSLTDWLRRNNAPKCGDCGQEFHATGEQDGDQAAFDCQCGYRVWLNIRSLSMREREEQ